MSDHIAKNINKHPNFNQMDKMEQMSYALQSLFGEFIKLVVLVILFLLVGQLPLFLISFLILASIRAFAGGYHASTVFSCLIFSIGFFIIAIQAGVYFQTFVVNYRYPILGSSLLIIALKAPIPSAYRPITDMKRYYRLKSVSITIALFWCLLLSEGYLDSTKSSIGIVTISLQAMQLLIRNIKKGELLCRHLKN